MLDDDGDIVRALGFVTLYASYLEEQIEELIELLEPVKVYSKGWQISDKITHARKVIRKLNCPELGDLICDLSTCAELFLERNELTHGRIYGGINRPETLRSSRPGIPDREVTSGELYQLASELWDFRSAVYGPTIFKLPECIKKYRDGA